MLRACLRRKPHQCNLVTAFNHATSSRHRSSAAEGCARRCFLQVVAENEFCRFLETNFAAREPAIIQSLGYLA
jgi:hypothetical protein